MRTCLESKNLLGNIFKQAMCCTTVLIYDLTTYDFLKALLLKNLKEKYNE